MVGEASITNLAMPVPLCEFGFLATLPPPRAESNRVDQRMLPPLYGASDRSSRLLRFDQGSALCQREVAASFPRRGSTLIDARSGARPEAVS